MLQRLTAVLIVLCCAPAHAHAPGGEETVFDTLSHHIVAAHHFPGMAALSLVLVVCFAGLVLKHDQRSRR